MERGGCCCEKKMVRRAYCGPLHVPKALLAANGNVLDTTILFATTSMNVLDTEVFLGLLGHPMNEIGQRLQPGRHIDSLQGSTSGPSFGFRGSLVDPGCDESVQEFLGAAGG
jgi:hypothetical protein